MEALKEALKANQETNDNQKENHKLLIFDENQKVSFFGGCTFMLNKSAKRLNIQPNVEYFETMSVSFNEKILREKKFLIIYASQTNKYHHILAFPTKKECKEIFKVIERREDPASNILEDETSFELNFLNPMIEEIQKTEMKKVELRDWTEVFLKSMAQEKQKSYQKVFKKTKLDSIFKDGDDDASIVVDDENNENQAPQNINNSNKNGSSRVEKNSNGEKRAALAEMQYDNGQPSPERSSNNVAAAVQFPRTPIFYDHSPHPHPRPTRRSRSINGGGTPRKRRRSNDGGEEKIVKRPNFNITHAIRRGENRQTLQIYLNEERTIFYLYYFRGERFVCPRCCPEKTVTARLIKGQNGEDDFLLLNRILHICKPLKGLNSVIHFTTDDHDSPNNPSASRRPIGG